MNEIYKMQLQHQFQLEQLEGKMRDERAALEKELKKAQWQVKKLRNAVPANYVYGSFHKGDTRYYLTTHKPSWDGLNWHDSEYKSKHWHDYSLPEGEIEALCGRLPKEGEVLKILREFHWA